MKVWVDPEPDDGVTEMLDGAMSPATVTDQEPIACQPEKTFALFDTPIYVFFVPAKAGVKISARLRIKLFPDVETEDAPVLRVHWLLFIDPALPRVAEPAFALPASFTRTIVFVEIV